MQNRNKTTSEQEEFIKTLKQMEEEDVPPQLIEEYAQTEVVRKALANVRYHADRMRDIRGSPERYDRVQSKIHTQGRHSPMKGNTSY